MTLVVHYPLQEDSGGTANDLAGSNDGTVNGATQGVTGLLGTSAYSFDGVDDDVSFPSLGIFDGSTGYTFALWINVPSSADATARGAAIEPRAERLTMLYGTGLGQIGANANNDACGFNIFDGSHHTVTNNANLTNYGWVHLAGVFDPSSGMKFYFNGSLVDSNTFTGTPSGGNGDNTIGQRGDGRHYINADIADVRIYDRVLSPTSIQYFYQSGVTRGSLVTVAQQL